MEISKEKIKLGKEETNRIDDLVKKINKGHSGFVFVATFEEKEDGSTKTDGLVAGQDCSKATVLASLMTALELTLPDVLAIMSSVSHSETIKE